MKTTLATIIMIALISVSGASEMVMRKFGTYDFKSEGFDVTIDLSEVAADGLAPKITFRQDGREGSTGIGKGSSLTVVPGRWAAQFNPPYELWIFDGRDKLQLYEQTVEPKGFKSSSSSIVPSLKERAPEEIKKLMQAAAKEKQ